MNKYSKQISCINKIARHFAMLDYHVTTTFFSSSEGCEVTIFFHDIQEKDSIETYLRKYKDDNDNIIFYECPDEPIDRKFYTLKLEKI